MLELKSISYTVCPEDQEKQIIEDLSVTIGDNRFVVITGPNGSGKSTLAKLIMGV